ncbi:hypothetical protein GOBAR_AA02643 [Gossypium barbadense]|uniref:Uncharacterized protein n=1 Tax=Gossypium barbadense TaxID=3634 RepID=A0A2P5YQT5_GOSBA|nr:hypothetical protein GOBAR_AA02643 [Gossypium barbadense]
MAAVAEARRSVQTVVVDRVGRRWGEGVRVATEQERRKELCMCVVRGGWIDDGKGRGKGRGVGLNKDARGKMEKMGRLCMVGTTSHTRLCDRPQVSNDHVSSPCNLLFEIELKKVHLSMHTAFNTPVSPGHVVYTTVSPGRVDHLRPCNNENLKEPSPKTHTTQDTPVGLGPL